LNCLGGEQLKERKTIFALKEDEIQRIRDHLAHAEPKYLFLFNFAINVGLRISDILPLKVKQVRGKDEFTITEQKTKKKRDVFISPGLQHMIAEYTKVLDDEDWLFPSRQGGGHLKRIRVYGFFNEIGKKAGLDYPIGTHTFRRTFGTMLYARTKDIVFVQRQLNHSSPAITENYLGLRKEDDKKRIMEMGTI